MSTSTITIRLKIEERTALDKHAKELKIKPSTFAKELLLNGLYARKDETLLSAFEDSEKKADKKIDSLQERISTLEGKLDNSMYGVATAVFLFLSRDDESDEDRKETKEYVQQIFPFWKG